MSIFLEERIDSRYPAIPGVFQILQRQSAVLGVGLLPLEPALADGVATRPRLPRETRRLSRDHDDGAVVALSHEDAIDATSQVQVQFLR